MTAGLLSEARRNVLERRLSHSFRRRYAIFVNECLRDSNGNPPADWQSRIDALQTGNQWNDSQYLGQKFLTQNRLANQYQLLERLRDNLIEKAKAVKRGLDDLQACYMTPDAGLNITQTVLKRVDEWQNDLKQFDYDRGRTFVCSDVHLGTNGAAVREFNDFLNACSSDDTLILLGDILDCWVDGTTNEENLKTVTAQWKSLYEKLEEVKAAGVDIHYIPGNHDPFVFTLHSHGHAAWSRDIRQFSEFISKLDDAVMNGWPLANVATVHYPFFLKEINKVSWLFTHGHVHETSWAFMGTADDLSGIRNEFSWADAYATALASAGAYKFREGLRRIYIDSEFRKAPENFLNDVGLLITHEVLHAANASGYLRAQKWEDISRLADEAFRRYTQENNTASVTKVKRGLERIRKATHARDLPSIREHTLNWMNNNSTQNNYSFCLDTRQARIVCNLEPIGKYLKFVNFVFGHFHVPDITGFPPPQGPVCADSGALLNRPSEIRSVLQINPDGWIGRPKVFLEAD